MKSKIIYCLNFIWTSFLAFSFPVCFGWIFLDITGHSKGYGYDLGAEKDVSVFLGCIELLVWLVLSLPSYIYIFRRTAGKSRKYLFLLTVWDLLLAVLCIAWTGGWSEYAEGVFNI